MKRFLPLAFLLVACGPSTESTKTPDQGASGPAATDPQKPGTNLPVAPVRRATDNPSRTHQLTELKKTTLLIKGHPVRLWVMDDDAKQQEGMMFLTDGEVKADEGMLFAFDSVQKQSYDDARPRGFWMHNTLIPLDIIYLGPTGKVLNIAHGEVQKDTTLPSNGDFLNVIELKAGTAARFGLKAGDVVSIPKR